MSTKPGAFALSKQAARFVFSNTEMLAHHLRVVLPLILLCDLAGSFLAVGGEATAISTLGAYALAGAGLFLYACFALGWHRASLQGPDKAHERNPFNLQPADWKFIGLFIGVTAALGVAMNAVDYIVESYLQTAPLTVRLGGGLAALVVIGALLLFFIRASFLFPAQSVGVSLRWPDTKRAARGMYWPIIGSSIIFALVFTVAFTVYAFVAGFIATVAAGNATGVADIVIKFIMSAPVSAGWLVIVALCVTALSDAYQWGIQNNN